MWALYKADKSLHFIYLDETGDEQCIGYSALAVPLNCHRDTLGALKAFRKTIRISDGIYTTREFHAAKFTSGRGRLGLPGKGIPQWRRCEIFNDYLRALANIPNVHLLNAFRTGDVKQIKMLLLEKLVNRIHKSVECWGSEGILFFDEGDARNITKLARKLSVYNPIQSKFGMWDDGKQYRNFPLLRFPEDPVFRGSRTSHLIQAVDFCAYALFQKENPTPSRARFGLNQSFQEILTPICVKAANEDDFFGIVR